jgi:hypothetical protein
MGCFTECGLEDPSIEIKRELAGVVYKSLFVPGYGTKQFVDSVLECIGVENTDENKNIMLHGITLGKTILSTQNMMDAALSLLKEK